MEPERSKVLSLSWIHSKGQAVPGYMTVCLQKTVGETCCASMKTSVKKPGMMGCLVNPVLRRHRQIPEALSSQASLFYDLQASEKDYQTRLKLSGGSWSLHTDNKYRCVLLFTLNHART